MVRRLQLASCTRCKKESSTCGVQLIARHTCHMTMHATCCERDRPYACGAHAMYSAISLSQCTGTLAWQTARSWLPAAQASIRPHYGLHLRTVPPNPSARAMVTASQKRITWLMTGMQCTLEWLLSQKRVQVCCTHMQQDPCSAAARGHFKLPFRLNACHGCALHIHNALHMCTEAGKQWDTAWMGPRCQDLCCCQV